MTISTISNYAEHNGTQYIYTQNTDIQQSVAQFIYTQYNDTRHINSQCIDTRHSDFSIVTLSLMTLSI
jgi:hypothetical protein